jgi:hypothetical protein
LALSLEPVLRDSSEGLLRFGEDRFRRALAERSLTPEQKADVERGSWSVALIIDPPRPDRVKPGFLDVANREFLDTILSSNPRLTGWPVWVDTRGFADHSARPKVRERAWEALIISSGSWTRHVDFWRLDPKGQFYHRRVLQDDLAERVEPGTALDPGLVIVRVAEAVAVGLAFAKSLGRQDPAGRLGFSFRWTKLRGRYLSTWANPQMFLWPEEHGAADDEITTFVDLPADTPPPAIAPVVRDATIDLFALFDGFSMPDQTIEALVQRTLERRW